MQALKRSLLGRPASPSVPGWFEDEGTRLGIVLSAVPAPLDYGDLDVENRIRDAWALCPEVVGDALTRVNVEALSSEQLRISSLRGARWSPGAASRNLAGEPGAWHRSDPVTFCPAIPA